MRNSSRTHPFWTPWFAWRPVRIRGGEWVWLEWVERSESEWWKYQEMGRAEREWNTVVGAP